MSSSHFGFIVAAYGVTVAVLLGMILAILADYRSLRKSLSRLEAEAQDQRL
jgi:heme exporter protein CcmD